jgi:hypothetical protein
LSLSFISHHLDTSSSATRPSAGKPSLPRVSHILMMAAPRTASRSLLGTRRKTMQYSWASFSTPQAAQSRSISYATRSNAFSNTQSTSNLLRATPKHLQNSQLSNSLPSRRAFSATRVAGHGDWHPPKAGEEYVKPSAIGRYGADTEAGSMSHLWIRKGMSIR